jgi:beta-galactosidase
MYYGADYYPEHWPRERWERDAELMAEAGINLVRVAEFAWALMEPEPGRYDYAWLDEALDVLAQRGIQAVMCTPTAAPPAWLCQQYPDTLLVQRNGRRVEFGMRRQYCPTSARYRQLSRQITTAMAQRYARHSQVVAWQLDNEFGGHHARCYCPACAEAFQGWLERRYGTLDALNDAWGTAFWSHTYTAWDQIPLPTDAVGSSNPGLELDFYRFSSDQWISYAQEQIDNLQAHSSAPITTNLMGLGFGEIDYFAMGRQLDFVTWDNYPTFIQQDPASIAASHTLMRGLRDQPFWVMEEQAGPSGWQAMSPAPQPGQLRLWSYQAMAHGADGIVYFRWRTCRTGIEQWWHGILDHHGEPGRRYQEIAAMGAEVRALGDRLLGALPPKAVAIVLAYDDRWAMRLQPNAAGFEYTPLWLTYYRAFHRLGVPVDVVPPDADLSPYALVVAPMLHVVSEAYARSLTAYVQQGGHLILGARSGVKDIRNRVVDRQLPGLLAELCGVVVSEYDALGAGNCVRLAVAKAGAGLGEDAVGHTWADVLAPRGAEILATYLGTFYQGEPATTLNRVGKGTATYVGVLPDQDLADGLARCAIERAGVAPLLETPDGVEVAARDQDGLRYLFLLNHTDADQIVSLPHPCRDLLAGIDRRNSLSLAPHGVAILEIPLGG